jgi:ABC-type transport system substrate-binding protein
MLAPFATDFAGTGMDLEAKDSKGNYLYEIEGHITGYKNDEYNAKIEEAFAEKDEEKRTALLIEAEKMLLDDMPVIPVVFNQDGYVISKELSKVDNSYFGSRIFTKTKLKDYEKYLPKTEG